MSISARPSRRKPPASDHAARVLWIRPAGQGGNYVQKLEALARTLSTTQAYVIGIYHGDRCLFPRTGYCTCDPEFRVEPVDGAA